MSKRTLITLIVSFKLLVVAATAAVGLTKPAPQADAAWWPDGCMPWNQPCGS